MMHKLDRFLDRLLNGAVRVAVVMLSLGVFVLAAVLLVTTWSWIRGLL